MSSISKINRNNKIRQILAACAILFIAIFVGVYLNLSSGDTKVESFSQYVADMDGGRIARVDIHSDYLQDSVSVSLKGDKKPAYTVLSPRSTVESVTEMNKKGIAVFFPPEPANYSRYVDIFVRLLMVGFFGFLIFQSVPNAFSFLQKETSSIVKFTDVAGAVEAKRAMTEIVAYLKNPKQYEKLGAKFPKGVMLFGDPGNGKTLLAKAVAGEAGVSFIQTSGADFGSMFVSVSSSKVKSLFARARRSAPCVIFIDEIDAIGGKRMSEGSAVAREMGSTLNQLLVQMDGFTANSGVVVIAATNRLDSLDSALLRSGRFDRHINVKAPNLQERQDILQVHGRDLPLDATFDYVALAKATTGMSGADLANVMNTAAIIATRADDSVILTRHAIQAKDDLVMGETNGTTSTLIDAATRRVIAVHESCHAVVAMAYGFDQVTAVSIISRSKSLGVTVISPEEDRQLHDARYIEAHLAMLFGGRSGEEVFEKMCTTGAEDDIRRATQMASDMVRRYGMSRLGMMRIDESSSPQLQFEADIETRRILDLARTRAVAILKHNQEVIMEMAKQLLDQEEIRRPEDIAAYRARLAMPPAAALSAISAGEVVALLE